MARDPQPARISILSGGVDNREMVNEQNSNLANITITCKRLRGMPDFPFLKGSMTMASTSLLSWWDLQLCHPNLVLPSSRCWWHMPFLLHPHQQLLSCCVSSCLGMSPTGQLAFPSGLPCLLLTRNNRHQFTHLQPLPQKSTVNLILILKTFSVTNSKSLGLLESLLLEAW